MIFSTTAVACFSTSGSGGKCGFGTAYTAIFAASADRSPFVVSSTAAQSSGATPSSSAARR